MHRQTPETYLGYERLERYAGTPIARDRRRTYTYASSLSPAHVTYGGAWTVGAQEITAGPGAGLRFDVDAADVYLVMAGRGTVTGTFDGKALPPVHVSGVPVLYTIRDAAEPQHGVLQLAFSPGLEAYAFTFG